jgi:hypothetical protein
MFSNGFVQTFESQAKSPTRGDRQSIVTNVSIAGASGKRFSEKPVRLDALSHRAPGAGRRASRVVDFVDREPAIIRKS